MPYSVIPSDGHFKVINTQSGKVHAKHTTKAKAEAQIRLLRGVEHGMVPRRLGAREEKDMGTTHEPVSADSLNPAPTPIKRRSKSLKQED